MASNPNAFIPGNAPTSVPAEYAITFHDINVQNDSISLKKQPQAFVSHGENFELWSVNEIVTHTMKKFVMTGGTRSLKQELTDTFTNGLIVDFIVTNGLMDDEEPSPIDENLVLQGENPFVSFAGRLGNSTSLLFTGLSSVKFCSTNLAPSNNSEEEGGSSESTTDTANMTGNNEDDNTTRMIQSDSSCEVWYDQISWPMYVFTIIRKVNGDDNGTTETEIFSEVTDMSSPIGFVQFNLVHDDGNVTNATNIIEEHMQKRKKKKWQSMLIIFVLVALATFLIYKAWMVKYRDYESL